MTEEAMKKMKFKEGLEEAYKKSIHMEPEGVGDTPGINAYVQGIIDYANNWANLMETCIENGESIESCADRTSHDADTDGITGNMYGNAVLLLSTYWEHGDTLKKWHNSQYGRPDAEGVVNPAILTISPKGM